MNCEPNFIHKIDINKYRIKLEEPNFKVGDWVRVKEAPDDVYKITDIDGNEIYGKDYIGYNTSEQIELWEPKKGEKIWVWNNYCTHPYLATFVTMDGDMYCTSEKLCGNSYWDNCEPFTGELPTKYKDK